jgi:hypothetical protein
MLLMLSLNAMASETHHEVNQALSWGIGVGTLALLLLLLAGLVAFGGGREHS